MKRISYLAGVMALIAFPALADKHPVKPETVTVTQCESEKIILLLELMRQDIARLTADLEEVQGDQQEIAKPIKVVPKPVPRPEKIK